MLRAVQQTKDFNAFQAGFDAVDGDKRRAGNNQFTRAGRTAWPAFLRKVAKTIHLISNEATLAQRGRNVAFGSIEQVITPVP